MRQPLAISLLKARHVIRKIKGIAPVIEAELSTMLSAYCFHKFHPLISDLVRGAWVRYVRQQNLKIVGEITDLNEFLFGSERAPLAVVRPVLLDLQRGRCFDCNGTLQPANTHVDHFVAWARYPVDLGHNFVLADSRCNGAKGETLPACDHLEAWVKAIPNSKTTSVKPRRSVGLFPKLAPRIGWL